MSTQEDCSPSDSGLWTCDESLYERPEIEEEGKSFVSFETGAQDGNLLEDEAPFNNCVELDVASCSPVATLTSGLDVASPEPCQNKKSVFHTPDDKSSRSRKIRKRTPRTLSRMMKKHRESERNRHQGLNYGIIQLSRMVPGHNENQRETKVVIMQRVINYMVFIEKLIYTISKEVGYDTDQCDLHLMTHLNQQQEEFSDIHPVLAEASQFLESISVDGLLKNIDNGLLSEFRDSQQPSIKLGSKQQLKRPFSECSSCECASRMMRSDSDFCVPTADCVETVSIVPSIESTPESPTSSLTPDVGSDATLNKPCHAAQHFEHASSRSAFKLVPSSTRDVDSKKEQPLKRFHSSGREMRPNVKDNKDRSESVAKKRRVEIASRIDLRKTSWMNGFMMYSRLNRKLYISERPGVPTSNISKLMGQAWRGMSAEEQQPYKEKAKLYAQYMLDAYTLPDDMKQT